MTQYETNIDDLNRIIEVNIQGQLRTHETREMGLKVRKIAKEKSYGIIFDYRAADASNIWVLDIDTTFTEVYDPIDKELRSIPVAILHTKQFNHLANFIALSWRAEGISTVAFENEAKGRKWIEDELKTLRSS